MAGYFLGIDPGLSGAFALLTDQCAFSEVVDLPTIARGRGRVKNELDPAGLARELMEIAPLITIAVVERVGSMPGQGVASVFSLGHSYGTILGVLAALGIPTDTPSPATWKRALGVDRNKEMARAAAIKRWPMAPLGRKKDHNRAEALFLAAYGITVHNKRTASDE